jgi:hypothetical protein
MNRRQAEPAGATLFKFRRNSIPAYRSMHAPRSSCHSIRYAISDLYTTEAASLSEINPILFWNGIAKPPRAQTLKAQQKSPANASHAGGSGLKAKRQSGDGRHDTKLAVILRLQIDLHCVSFWIATAISAAFRLIHIIAKLMLWIARAAVVLRTVIDMLFRIAWP